MVRDVVESRKTLLKHAPLRIQRQFLRGVGKNKAHVPDTRDERRHAAVCAMAAREIKRLPGGYNAFGPDAGAPRRRQGRVVNRCFSLDLQSVCLDVVTREQTRLISYQAS